MEKNQMKVIYLGGLGGNDVIEEKLKILVDCVEDELVVDLDSKGSLEYISFRFFRSSSETLRVEEVHSDAMNADEGHEVVMIEENSLGDLG